MNGDTERPTFDFSSANGVDSSTGQSSAFNPSTGAGGTAAATGVNMTEASRDTGGYKGTHPVAATFHVLFKAGAALTFLLGSIFSLSYVAMFVLTVLFVAFDFWTTKNITGRLLVSLRWWSETKEDGSTRWVFESSPDAETRVHPFDSRFFWISSGLYFVFWVLMCIMNLLSPKSLPIAIVGFLLSGSNLLGYIKCQRDARSRVTTFLASQVAQRPDLAQQAAASMFSAASGSSSSPQQK